MYMRTPDGVVPANESPIHYDTLGQLLADVQGLPCEEGR